MAALNTAGPQRASVTEAHVDNDADETTALLGAADDQNPDNGATNGRKRSSSSASDRPRVSLGRFKTFAVILSTWALIFLQASNMSGVTTTQSAIADDLEEYEKAMWFSTAYLMSTSALSPLVGRLATIFSPRVLALPIGLFFAAGGITTAMARTFGVFILGRVLTGVAGAGIMTLAVILVLELTGKKTRGVFIGLVNCGFTIGLSTGAVVYGALLPVIGWRLLFGVQAPVALAASLGVFFSLPSGFGVSSESKDRNTREKLARIDYAGALMLTTSIVLFLFGLSGDVKWVPIILSLVALFVFATIEVFVASDPIIPLSVLRSRSILLSCVTQLGFMSARWTILFYSPVYVGVVWGYAPALAGSILIPTNIGFGSGGLIVGWLHVRRNGAFWLPSIIGLAIFGVTMLGLSLVATASTPKWLFILAVFLNGLATGASLNYTLAHLLHLSRPSEHFITTSLMGTFRGFGGSFGTAIGGGIFYRMLRQELTEGFSGLKHGLTPERRDLITRLIGSPAAVHRGGLSQAEQAIAVEGYASASRGTWQAAAALAVLVVILQAATGWAGPQDKIEDEEAEVRANLLENEGVVEA
ncbi:major facilitator superfamily domain-containing protein [Plectosphaerella plurivora]|uniref:Major facilitator superfamily domain-containing protein n=1 Tax=Plectosphaerella plurivora TaxID=936078 RepID=A0A9P9ACI9_9PEZI|nr:major facilitator superfamily domain-containing protein [Plectosphaerella plurivora]